MSGSRFTMSRDRLAELRVRVDSGTLCVVGFILTAYLTLFIGNQQQRKQIRVGKDHRVKQHT